MKQFIEKFCVQNHAVCKNKEELEKLLEIGKCEEKIEIDQDNVPTEITVDDVEDNDDLFKKRTKTTSTINKETIHTSMNSQIQSQMFKSSQGFLMTYLKLSDKEKSLIGHSIKDLIKSCTFR